MFARIRARDYRLLHNVDQALGSFHVLVGGNATGKSTFLDVPRLLGDFVREGVRRAIEARAAPFDDLVFNFNRSVGPQKERSEDRFEPRFSVAVVFVLPSDIADRTGFSHAQYEVEFGRAQEGHTEIRSESFDLGEANSFTPSTPETDASGNGKPQTRIRTVARRIDRQTVEYVSETDDFQQNARLPSSDESALAAVARDVDRFPATLWAADLLSRELRHIQLNVDKMRAPVSPLQPRRLLSDGSNLALVIQHLQWQDGQNDTTVFEDWQRHVRTILPDLNYVFPYERQDDRHLGIEVKYTSSEARVPASLLSDGTLRLFALTLIPYLDETDAVYEIEEPENGIHPRGIEAVYQSLSSVYRGQVLVATHSPIFLGLAQPQDILCFRRTEDEGTTVEPGNEHPALKDWHGEIPLSTIHASGILG